MTAVHARLYQELAIQIRDSRPIPAPVTQVAEAEASRDLAPWLGKTAARWPASRLVGREGLIAEIREHLDENVLIVSGTGESGVGTTSVARSVVRAAAGAYPDGCIVINLRCDGPLGPEPLTPAQVQRRVLWSLRVVTRTEDLPEDPPSLGRMYQGALSSRKALLVLDDAVSAAQLRHLLPQKGSAAIVTSQHDLAASYPKLFTATVEGLQAEDAYHLITQMAPAASDLSSASVAALVARLQGVPLALRIVAPLLGKRQPLLLPRRLLGSLDTAQKRYSALRGSSSPNSAAHTAIEVAYELLDSELKPYFEALGVFPAPFTARAASTVWNISPESAEQILSQLATLAMLDIQPESPYYELHDLVRLHAQELLLSQPDRAREMVSRYVEHFMREVIQASAKSNGTEPERLAPEVDAYTLWAHLPAAWVRAIGRDPGWPAPKAMQRWVCDFPLHSQAILLQSLSRSEYEVWVENALEAAEALRDWRITSLHLSTLGKLSVQAGDNQAALGYFKRQADVARESNSSAAEAEALMNAGVTHGALGQISQAEQDWQSALDLFERLDDRKADRVRVWLRELRSRFSARS